MKIFGIREEQRCESANTVEGSESISGWESEVPPQTGREKSLSTKTKHKKLMNPLSDLHMHIYLKKKKKWEDVMKWKRHTPEAEKP